jgi:alcohol dehydrogenase
LIDTLEELTDRMAIPRLAAYGVTEQDIPRLVANCRGSSMKTNPIVLRDEEIAGLIRARI